MKRRFLTGVLVFLLPAAAFCEPLSESAWEEISRDNGIIVHRQEVTGSDILAFRGEGVIDATIAKVAAVLVDTSRKKEWTPRLVEVRDVRQISSDERIEYHHTASGFFAVRDRDFVMHAKADYDTQSNRLTFYLKSATDPAAPPQEDKIRGEMHRGLFVLTPVEDRKKTKLVIEIHVDPKGSVPKWLVNLFQKHWPRKMIENIRSQALKPDIVDHPKAKAVFLDLNRKDYRD